MFSQDIFSFYIYKYTQRNDYNIYDKIIGTKFPNIQHFQVRILRAINLILTTISNTKPRLQAN